MGKKKWQTNIAPLQPSTLAAFRPWGSSTGAGRADLPLQKYEDYLAVQIYSAEQGSNDSNLGEESSLSSGLEENIF
jgi:hypothetical protein